MKKLLFLVLLSSILWANYKPLKINEGKKLPLLSMAKLKDINLAKSIKYFTLCFNDVDNNGNIKVKSIAPSKGYSFDNSSWEKLSQVEQKSILSQKPIAKYPLFATNSTQDGRVLSIATISYIDTNSKVSTFSSMPKLKAFLGKIDTPTELALMFYSKEGRVTYKDMGNFYLLRSDWIYQENDGSKNSCYYRIEHFILSKKSKRIRKIAQDIDRGVVDEKKCAILRERFR